MSHLKKTFAQLVKVRQLCNHLFGSIRLLSGVGVVVYTCVRRCYPSPLTCNGGGGEGGWVASLFPPWTDKQQEEGCSHTWAQGTNENSESSKGGGVVRRPLPTCESRNLGKKYTEWGEGVAGKIFRTHFLFSLLFLPILPPRPVSQDSFVCWKE